MESRIEGSHALIFNKRAASGSRSLEEGYPRLRLVWIHGYRVSGTVKIAAANIAAIQIHMSRVRVATEYNQAGSQPRSLQLSAARLVKQTRKRAGIMTGIGLGTEVDAVVSSEYGVDRQKSCEERKDRDDWTLSDAFHVSLASAANSFAITATCNDLF
jgi:hypothetical protein